MDLKKAEAFIYLEIENMLSFEKEFNENDLADLAYRVSLIYGTKGLDDLVISCRLVKLTCDVFFNSKFQAEVH